MRSPMPCRFLAPCLILFLGSAVLAADPAKPADRDAVLAKLKANKVSLLRGCAFTTSESSWG